MVCLFFKQKTAYEMRISDWSSDVCSSDLFTGSVDRLWRFHPTLICSRVEVMKTSAAEILREYGPFPGAEQVHGVTFDGRHVWFASGDKLNAFDLPSGKTVRSIDVAAHAGTAFDGRPLFQFAEDPLQKIEPPTGRVLATIPAPGGDRKN